MLVLLLRLDSLHTSNGSFAVHLRNNALVNKKTIMQGKVCMRKNDIRTENGTGTESCLAATSLLWSYKIPNKII